MPADRFLHPRLVRDDRVSRLTDLEARVLFEGYLLSADDFGVCRRSALPIQELNDALAKRPARKIEQCLTRLVELGLLLSFDVQGRPYVCSASWQDEQKIRWPRESLNPLPPADIWAQCSAKTQDLFRAKAATRTATTPNDSGGASEALQQDSRSTSETLPVPTRAGAREEANGYRLSAIGNRREAAGNRLPAANASGHGLRERFDAFWAAYPKKTGKDAAWRAWQKRTPTSDLTDTMLAALAWQRQQDSWLRDGGRFVPNPATWLNEGRWQDEPNTTPRISEQTLALGRAAEEFLK